MNIEQHVPKLETCQKLQEAGWKIETLMYMHECLNGSVQINMSPYTADSSSPKTTHYAPLLSELLEVLPSTYKIARKPRAFGALLFKIIKVEGVVHMGYGDQFSICEFLTSNINPAEAAAQLVLTLVEDGSLTL